MSKIDGAKEKSDDFALSSVPESETKSGWSLAFIIIGGIVGFSVFLVSSQVGGSLGYRDATIAFLLGGGILGCLGAVTSYVAAKSRLSTYMLTEFAFGRQGAKVANIVIAISLIGWYAVISNFLGQAMQHVLQDMVGLLIPVYLLTIIASVMMITVTLKGFSGIDKLALALVPFMVAFLIYAALKSDPFSSANQLAIGENAFTFKTAVSAVVGSYIAGVVIQPDYSRFAINKKQAVWSVFISLGVGYPLIMVLSAIPSMVAGNPDLLVVMSSIGLIIPACFLLLFGSWSSNVLCLYSSALSISTLIPKTSLKTITFIIGVIGTSLALVQAQSYLIDFLVILGLTIPPIGAIYCTEIVIARRQGCVVEGLESEPAVRIIAFVSWFVGTFVGYLSQSDVVTITLIPSLDALLVSSILFGCVRAMQSRTILYEK
ncbi:cytosine permease [Alteromonas sp. C1M14]|uniref:purine-cytosine permease family protein n=1 Tax=Alteromonas sp. C1M14 TaxID=2841567 RepID=UPI001C0A2C28|nr:cytosine permease [Alteromonas sp. C1M14]MBU2979529.1 cytosine permease [Alteromonas sp. C1M14]